MKISYLIVVKNKARTIDRCLGSLVKEGVDEVVVVDGGSTDGTSEIIDRFPVLHLYDEGKGNISAARNIGLKKCNRDYIVIIDGDQWVPNGFHSALKRLLARREYDAVILHEVWIGSSIWAKTRQAEWVEVATLRHDWVYWPRVFSRSVLSQVGGWNEDIFIEDFDLWNRVKTLNPKVLKSNLAIYSDGNVSPFGEFKRGTEGISSLPKYVQRYPKEWQRFLAIAPLSWPYDIIIALKVLLKTTNLKVAVLTLVLRIAKSIGRFIGLFYHPTRQL